MVDDVKKSVRRLMIYVAVCVAAAVTAFLFRVFHWRFWPCSFYEITGLYCLACGSTRAALALAGLDIITSIQLNPIPVMLVMLMLWMVGHEVVNIVRRKNLPFRWFPHAVIVMLGVAVVYFFWRNFGGAPTPDMLY